MESGRVRIKRGRRKEIKDRRECGKREGKGEEVGDNDGVCETDHSSGLGVLSSSCGDVPVVSSLLLIFHSLPSFRQH